MVRLFSTYFPKRIVLLVVSETLLVFLALVGVLVFSRGGDIETVFASGREVIQITAVGLICLICLYYQDLYDARLTTEPSQLLGRLARALGVASILLAVVYIVFPAAELKGGLAVIGITLVGACLATSHHAFASLNRAGWWSTPTLVIGDGQLAGHVVDAIQRQPALGFRLVGYIGSGSNSFSTEETVPCLGSVEDLRTIVRRYPVERVVVAMEDRRAKFPVETLLDLKTAGVTIQEGTEFYELATGTIPVSSLRPSWLIFGEGFKISRMRSFVRRVASLSIAAIGLICCLPILPLIAIAVKLSSPGPVFFRQQRVGRGGKPFNVYKFRTMRQDAEARTGPVWARKGDPRVTNVGKILRATRLDEIPQLWNVLIGDMGFVGPRPERPEFVSWLSETLPYYNLRHIIRPGVTGWAQTRYQYGATLEETQQKLQYDLFYIKHMSLSLDFLIIFETIKTVILRRGSQ